METSTKSDLTTDMTHSSRSYTATDEKSWTTPITKMEVQSTITDIENNFVFRFVETYGSKVKGLYSFSFYHLNFVYDVEFYPEKNVANDTAQVFS